jgi:hypothetical protein
MHTPTQTHGLSVAPAPSPQEVLTGLVVVLPLGVGGQALERMAADGLAVGPVMACERHRTVRIPVPACAADTPLTRHLDLAWTLECPEAPGCPARTWWCPPSGARQVGVLTDHCGLCDCVHRVKRLGQPRVA